jgi:hypothetical protein
VSTTGDLKRLLRGSGKSRLVLAFSDPDEKAALRRSGHHVADRHETQPAEHSHFSQRAGPGENRPYALCEIFIQSHRRDLPH